MSGSIYVYLTRTFQRICFEKSLSALSGCYKKTLDKCGKKVYIKIRKTYTKKQGIL